MSENKIVLMLSVAVLFCTVCLLVNVNNQNMVVFETTKDETSVVVSFETSDYFDMARYNRKITRDQSISSLKSIVSQEKTDEETSKYASEMIVGLSLRTEKEMVLESEIKSKGYEDCVVLISDETISVMVKTEGLSRAESAQIMHSVCSATKYSADVIKIIEIK